ncbi:MAG TPA: GntG family PLP-dependent aldolase [Acidimicrobiales bacterium]|nr:GntG family PLP-dependent aldolase [Acidimicrobiales bacterium]
MGDGMVDLRSDTVTRPTPEMRRAMAEAEVGDDVYREDPTVNALEATFASRVGKQAALFVPSGTMGNQIALRVLSEPATLVVAGRRQHVVVHEHGGGGRNAGIQFHTVPDDGGNLSPSDVRWALDASEHHHPRVGMVAVENTHMHAGGRPWAVEALDAVVGAARGLPVHMDGARLFNAEVATGTPAATYAAHATTVMCCLSKGLCAPVGSLLAGSHDVMAAAREERARMGGGMRQAGIIAAAGLVSLNGMVERLADDHRRALRLAEAVAERWPGAGCEPTEVSTNIVMFAHDRPALLLDHLRSEGVLAGTVAPGVVRLMTHHDVDDEGIERVAKALSSAP